DAVVFTRSSVDIYNEKVVRATAGSLFHVPVVRDASVQDTASDLRGRGFAVLAADPSGTESLYDTDFSRPTALVFGNEARGLPDDVLELADRTIRIPIAGRAESLNLAAATAVVMYEAARQRGAGPSLASIVGGSAHDIRSPLAAMLGFSSTMLGRWDRLDDAQKLAMVEGIAHDAARMRLLVAQRVDAARITSGRLELRPGPVDALEVAMQVRQDVAGPDGSVEITGEPVIVWADPDRLHTILAGLVEAAQWWGQDGPVRIDVSGPRLRGWRQGGDMTEGQIRAVFAPWARGTGGGSKVGR